MSKLTFKQLIATVITLFSMLYVQSALAGSVRIYNNDSTLHIIELSCAGSSKTLAIKSSSTSTYTFHSSQNNCKIVGGSVSFPSGQLSDGQAWKIANGKASKN